MNKNKIMQTIMELDFMVVDLHLYLDTHPRDRVALEKYKELITDIEILKDEYAKLYGPLHCFGKNHDTDYGWLKEPWPHENAMILEVHKGDI